MTDFEKDIDRSLTTFLTSGGIILYPTDTIWGIGCDATNPDAVKKIFQLKKRKEKKSMIILVSDVEMIGHYVSNPSQKMLSLSYSSNQNRPQQFLKMQLIYPSIY